MHFFHNEVSSEAIQGYLRQGTQIEQVWQQIDEQVTNLTLGGMTPWEAASKLGEALAFARACRLNVVLVQKLVEGADPKHSGFLPRASYDQAQALGEVFEPMMEEAIKALDPGYRSSYRLPLRLRRVPAEGSFPAPHLLGLLAAGRETREWAAGLLAQYEVAMTAPKLPIPPAITAHLEAMKHELALGDFHLTSGVNMLGGLSDGKPVADALGAEGEGLLWEAMESFYRISQLLAYPGGSLGAGAAPSPTPGRRDAGGTPPTPASTVVPPVFAPAALSPGERARISSHVSDMLTQFEPAQTPQNHPAPAGGTPAGHIPIPASETPALQAGARDLLSELQMQGQASGPAPDAADAAALLDQMRQSHPVPGRRAASGTSDPTPRAGEPPAGHIPTPASGTPAVHANTPDLLHDLRFQTPPADGHQPEGGHPSAAQTTEKKVADLLADLGGEPKDAK